MFWICWEKPAINSVEVSGDHSAPSNSDETTRKLLQGENTFIVIDDD